MREPELLGATCFKKVMMNFRKFFFMDQQLRVLLTVRKTCPKLKDKTLRYFIRTAR